MRPASDLLSRFFNLLDERQLAACAELVQAERARPDTDGAWLDYLQAILYSEQTPPRWDLAEQTLQHALTADPADDLAARLHLELAFAADYLGQYAQAIGHNRISLALFERIGDLTYQAKVLRNTGIAHTRAYERGEAGPEALADAHICHGRSLAIFQALGEERLQANVEMELGTVHKALGHWAEAAALYTARAVKCRRFGWQRSLALTLNNLGEVHHHLRQWDQAVTHYTEALAILANLEAADPYEEADVQANLARTHQAQGSTEDALQASDHAIRLIEIIRSPLGGEDARIGFFGTRISIYEQRIGFELDLGRLEAGLSILERAKSRAFAELLAGKVRMPMRDHATTEQASLQEVDPLTAAEIQRRLPQDTLLLEYFIAPDRACVFTVTSESCSVTPLDSGVGESLGNIFEPGQQRPQGLAPDGRGQLHEPWTLRHLHRLLLAPVVDQLRGRPRVCIVPYGALHYIPFHALLANDQSGSHYFIEEQAAPPEIIYAPSATVLLDYCRSKPASRGQGGLVVSFGPDLRYVYREAEAVHARLGGLWRQGRSATAAAFLRDGPNYPILHFSGHASFDPDDPLASGLDLSRGRLSVRQILDRLQLHADLVVLGGCETGQSRVQRGDELTGLVRAFIYAGTPAVLVTLWPVDDISTCILMERFYDGLRVGARPAQALRRAQLDLMRMPMSDVAQWLQANSVQPRTAAREIDRLRTAVEKVPRASQDRDPLVFAHPYYWAPFILVGDRLPT